MRNKKSGDLTAAVWKLLVITCGEKVCAVKDDHNTAN